MTTQAPSASGPGHWIAIGKDLLGLLRDLMLVVLFLMLVLAPAFVGSRLEEAGFVKGSMMGFDWQARSKILGKTSRELEQALEEARRQLKLQADTIAANQKVISQLALRAGNASTVQQMTEENAAVLERSRAVDAATAKALQRTAPVVEQARVTAGDSLWAVVLAGDQQPAAAQYEVERARRRGLKGAQLFLRQGWYRTVVPVADRAAAAPVLDIARRREASAYLVDLRAWCPVRSVQSGVTVCG